MLRATFRLALQAIFDPEHALDPERGFCPDRDAAAVRRGERAARRAGLGEVSAAARALTAQPLALDAADEAGLLADLDPASRALLLSQAGDDAGCFFTVLPTAPEFNVP